MFDAPADLGPLLATSIGLSAAHDRSGSKNEPAFAGGCGHRGVGIASMYLDYTLLR